MTPSQSQSSKDCVCYTFTKVMYSQVLRDLSPPEMNEKTSQHKHVFKSPYIFCSHVIQFKATQPATSPRKRFT